MKGEIDDTKKTQMEILQIKNIISEMKKYMGWKKKYLFSELEDSNRNYPKWSTRRKRFLLFSFFFFFIVQSNSDPWDDTLDLHSCDQGSTLLFLNKRKSYSGEYWQIVRKTKKLTQNSPTGKYMCIFLCFVGKDTNAIIYFKWLALFNCHFLRLLTILPHIITFHVKITPTQIVYPLNTISWEKE